MRTSRSSGLRESSLEFFRFLFFLLSLGFSSPRHLPCSVLAPRLVLSSRFGIPLRQNWNSWGRPKTPRPLLMDGPRFVPLSFPLFSSSSPSTSFSRFLLPPPALGDSSTF